MIRDYLRRIYRAALPLIYARTNYKLFLRRGFTDLDDSLRRIALTTDIFSSIVGPIRISAPFGESMLVVAPHQDDELIGCGGALIKHLRSGRRARVVFVQDGGNEHAESGMTRQQMIDLREAEANAVARALGMGTPRYVRCANLNRETAGSVAASLREEIEQSNANAVFTPFVLDYNQDHRMTNLALAAALANCKKKPLIYGYEVWGLCIANTALIIDDVMETKQNLLALYESQTSGTDYVNCVTGLNMYRSRTFGAGTCKYAECFFEMPADEFVEVVTRLNGPLPSLP